MAEFDHVKPRDLFGAVDLDGSGYIDRDELAAVCDLDADDLAEVFDRLDADKDGRISIEEFSENFKKFKNVVSGVKRKKSERSLSADGDYEDLKDKLGQSFGYLSGQEYVSELFHYLHSSSDSPQLLALLESFLFSVVRDVKHYSSENHRLEDALKRTCEKHTEHMDQLDSELEQQMQRMESRIRKEEKSKQDRYNLDLVWQLEGKNKEIQTMSARVQKLEGRIKKKEPEEQKIKEEVDEKVQEIRFLRSQLTDAQTNLAVLRSELAQQRNDQEEQEAQLAAEKRTVVECVQEQESLTRQLQLLHEANKKLHDTNDDLRSALENRKVSDKRSPSLNKRHSISTLYSPNASMAKKSKSPSSRSRRASAGTSEDFGLEEVDGKSLPTTPSRMLPSVPPSTMDSARRDSLLPSQQSCEVDEEPEMNENSLMTELIQVQQLTVPEEDQTEVSSESSEQHVDYNNNAGILNSRETGRIHHLVPPARQSCEVEGITSKDVSFFDEPVILGHCTMGIKHKTGDTALLTSDDTDQSDTSKDKLLRNSNGSRLSSRFGKYFGKLSKNKNKENTAKPSEEETIYGGKQKSEPKKGRINVNSKRDSNTQEKTQSKPQDIKPLAKESKRGKNSASVRSKMRLLGSKPGQDDTVLREQQNKRGSVDRKSLSKTGENDKPRKMSSVTFSPTVTCKADSTTHNTRRTAKNIATRRALTTTYTTNTSTTETSDTDSTIQELKPNFHHEMEVEEDEPYNGRRSSERETFSKQLDILQETNKRLCESNDDLRYALEALTGRRPSIRTPKSRRSNEKCQRNPSIHSDYGSISSRSITPNHLQGPKCEDDVGDGAEAEELSGYEPESDVNTMTIKEHHFEAAPKLSKLSATPHDRHVIAEEPANDVEWESDAEGDVTNSQQPTRTASNFSQAHAPFDRNSNLRKPCRHKSLEQLFNKSNSKGDRSAWPSIARAGQWNSMEQMRRRNDFMGERSRSLPTSRWQSDEGINSGTGVGFWQLSEKLNALRSSKEDIPDEGVDLPNKAEDFPNKAEDFPNVGGDLRETVNDALSDPPLLALVQSFKTEVHTSNNDDLAELIRKPVPVTATRKINQGGGSQATRSGEGTVEFVCPTEGTSLKRRNSLVIKRNRSKTDSLPESDHSRPDALSAELEAQFKSVIEEDEEDIDEDDVGDEELAQLVAMATAQTESEEETETETEEPEGERGAAVGSDSTSESSANALLNAPATDGNVPERMYKLVLAGDAAVGKSSFILRLCRNRFHSALNSTLGVDFQMKTMCIDGKTIALQLWDTAGQERFRSIAKSYFRKADGVLLLYDVTCETSFLNVRDWVEAIEDSTSKPIPIMLCGNKIDLRQSCADEGKTIISEENGHKLAKEYGALFLETSSKENRNVTEACEELGRLLRNIEDQEVEESSGLRLADGDHKNKKKINCCPT